VRIRARTRPSLVACPFRPVCAGFEVRVDREREYENWQALARQRRVDVVRATAAARSGHPTSCLSAADLAQVR
jgi:hypothetical protein